MTATTEIDGFTASKDDPAMGGSEFVRLGGQKRAPTAERADIPNEAVNLCQFFKDEELKNMANKCLDDYSADVRSRTPRMKKLREFTELYSGLMKAKSFPFQNAANVNLPVLTGPCLQVHARLYDMVWPANGKILYSSPTNPSDTYRAQTTELFANSYIRRNMPEMGVGLDDTMAQVVIYGSAFRRTYWNTYEWRVCSDWIPIEDFVVAHSVRSQDPSMRDVPRYTMVQHLTIFDLEQYGRDGVFVNVDGIRAGDEETNEGKSDLRSTVDKVDGVSPGSEGSEEDKTRQVLEMHRMWRMPKRAGKKAPECFDGKPHPVIVTIDAASKRILRFVVREEDDPTDAKRFQRENQPYQEYLIKQQVYEQQLETVSRVTDAAQAMGKFVPPNLMPVAPQEVPEPKPQRKRAICFFTHYRAFPSEGFYGLGFGDFIGPLNKAANTLLNQHIDGVTLRNAKPVFMSRQLQMQRGSVNIQPGEIVEVDGPTSALKEGIFFLDPPQNDPTTMPLVELIAGQGDKVAGSGDIMSGDTSGANRTAKEIQVLNSQVMMQISILARRIKEAFKHELDKIWRCFGVFLEDSDMADIIDEAGAPKQIPIGRSMFLPDAHVMPAVDPRMRFEKIQDQMQLYSLIQQSPYIQQSANAPQINMMATVDLLRAHGAERYIPLVPSPPPPPPPPPPLPHWDEESGFLRGQDHPVHPDDNDMEHIQGHKFFGASPAGGALDKNGRDMLDRHVRAHVAQAWQKMHGTGPQPGSPPAPGMQAKLPPPSHHGPNDKPPPPPGASPPVPPIPGQDAPQ